MEEARRRRACVQSEGLLASITAIRQIQVSRFRLFYNDLLNDQRHGQATRFFLTELYGGEDYADRDAQFARIGGALERLFPERVIRLAVDIAAVHALTEDLDAQMAKHWSAIAPAAHSDCRAKASSYVACWNQVLRPLDRDRQLHTVLAMGWLLADVVRIKGLRTGLRLMRRPAHAAGLANLQKVLEDGFDAFLSMGEADVFLDAIAARESQWLDTLFNHPELATDRLAEALLTDELSVTSA
jgi:hypothetical protein